MSRSKEHEMTLVGVRAAKIEDGGKSGPNAPSQAAQKIH